MTTDFPELDPSVRILMGPGPSDVSPRVLAALARPTLGHLDPEYLRIMDDTRKLLQYVFRTANELTVAMPGTGSAGMETCVANLIEPGDEMVVGVNGVFGGRMADVAERCGAVVHTVEAPWGEIIEPDAIRRALIDHPETRVVGVVHAETSTGAHSPVEEIAAAAHDAGALVLVDAVTSLGGVELEVDDWGIDACYSGTQKCLSCPPGLAPISLSTAAVEKLHGRKTKVQSWYLDLSMISQYWGENRVYHHTAPINMSYALYEALRMVAEEGLETRHARHLRHHRALRAGLEAMGLRYIPKHSLPNLNAIHVAEGADDAVVRRRLLEEYGIEIGAGLGPFAGKAWRIGIMGSSCTQRNVVMVLGALETILSDMGVSVPSGAALQAAGEVYSTA
jgi:alanine-glyoxylate transaminase/serine-glyoxylate transaminase/serine-pyruvate transaminase